MARAPSFIYITRRARMITTYHRFLEEEFQKEISIHALRRLVRKESLDLYLKQPDFDGDPVDKGYFNPEEVFDLVQVDGCKFQYFKIRDENGNWRKPQPECGGSVQSVLAGCAVSQEKDQTAPGSRQRFFEPETTDPRIEHQILNARWILHGSRFLWCTIAKTQSSPGIEPPQPA
jgi:hypothetical protein